MYALNEDNKYDIHHGGIDEGFFQWSLSVLNPFFSPHFLLSKLLCKAMSLSQRVYLISKHK